MRGAGIGTMPRILHVVKVCRALLLYLIESGLEAFGQRLPGGCVLEGVNATLAHGKGMPVLLQFVAAGAAWWFFLPSSQMVWTFLLTGEAPSEIAWPLIATATAARYVRALPCELGNCRFARGLSGVR